MASAALTLGVGGCTAVVEDGQYYIEEAAEGDGPSLGDATTETGTRDAEFEEGAITIDAATDGGGACGAQLPCATPSCAGGGAGLSNCGPNDESCCISLAVTGGMYFRTYGQSVSAGAAASEADPATISAFRLDKYLVTVGRFRQFAAAWSNGAGYAPPATSGKHAHLNGGRGLRNVGDDAGLAYEPGWVASDSSSIAPTDLNLACSPDHDDTWTASAGSNENLPMNCINWYEAEAFCIWDGGFLPSEAEWEYAAAGGWQQREYPWGSTDPGAGNEYAIYDCDYPDGETGCVESDHVVNVAPVGTATEGVGLWGQLDLAGEVGEWTLDFQETYQNPCMDCGNLTFGGVRVVRSGSYRMPADLLISTYRGLGYAASSRLAQVGFRCARTP
jgi:formylglycine-generating enzyme required for sulfatase activity